MENPFVFGKPVKGASFIDRRGEIQRLVQYMESSQNAIIYSPRKFGKTSLVLKAIEETEGTLIPVVIDCYAITSEQELGRRLTQSVLRHYREREIFDAVFRLFHELVPSVTIKTVPEIRLELDWERTEDWREACELPERLAEDRKTRVVVVFDEFQELGRFDNLLNTLRSSFQHHTRVSYIFIGSKRHMMEWIFRNRESPFYNFGAHLTLREIPAGFFKAFITDAFGEASISIDEEVIDSLLRLTGCHPHYTQRLCFELWYRGLAKGVVGPDDLEDTVRDVIADLEDSYLAIWDALSFNQRKALLAVVLGESDLFSGEFARRHMFTSPASVQSAIRKLVERDIVVEQDGDYAVADLFLGFWLGMRFIGDRSPFRPGER